MKLLIWFFLSALLVPSCLAGSHGNVVDVPSSHGAPTRTLVSSGPPPKATVLLFIGGGGLLKIADSGRVDHVHTFVRSFGMWRDHGIQAVLIDSPIDLGNAMRGHRRTSKEHLDRVSEVIRHFHAGASQPVWIFGHSMGTSTVAGFLSSNRPEIALLGGYVVAGTHRGESVPAAVKLPVLAIHHRREGCPSTPVSASETIISSRTPDTPRSMVLLDGGDDKGDRCQALAYHGFNGIEQDLIRTAAEFVLRN